MVMPTSENLRVFRRDIQVTDTCLNPFLSKMLHIVDRRGLTGLTIRQAEAVGRFLENHGRCFSYPLSKHILSVLVPFVSEMNAAVCPDYEKVMSLMTSFCRWGLTVKQGSFLCSLLYKHKIIEWERLFGGIENDMDDDDIVRYAEVRIQPGSDVVWRKLYLKSGSKTLSQELFEAMIDMQSALYRGQIDLAYRHIADGFGVSGVVAKFMAMTGEWIELLDGARSQEERVGVDIFEQLAVDRL